MNPLSQYVYRIVVSLSLLFYGAHLVTTDALAQAPGTITHQGCLTDISGSPVADGPYSMTLTLYDASSEGNQLWTDTFAAVAVEGCVFDIVLGGQSPLPTGGVWDQAVWLGVSVAGEKEMDRTALSSVPFAKGLSLPIEATVNSPSPGLLVSNLSNSAPIAIQGSVSTASSKGVYGLTTASVGNLLVAATSGVYGEATATDGQGHGVSGATSSSGGIGVRGINTSPATQDGVGNPQTPTGVFGSSVSPEGRGVFGQVSQGAPTNQLAGPFSGGVVGRSIAADGISYGVYGEAASPNGHAVHGIHHAGGHAAWFVGNANVRDGDLTIQEGGTTAISLLRNENAGAPALKLMRGGNTVIELDANFNGDARIITEEIQITGGSDLAESFDINVEPDGPQPQAGLLVSIDPTDVGRLLISNSEYDPLVAGVVSGAGGIESGMIMGHRGTLADGAWPVAIAGRVYVQADATDHPIAPGDMLTTSTRPGFAQKVVDRSRAFGTVVGKAMSPLDQGTGLVLVLLSLQ